MRVITEKELQDNFEYYVDLVGEKKQRIKIIRENGKDCFLEPIIDEEVIK